MGSFPFPLLLLAIFLIFSLLIPSASADDDTRSVICSHNFIAAKHKNYTKNVENLMSLLLNQAPPHDGFYMNSSGPVYGLALCQVGIPATRCKDCLLIATYFITVNCPNYRRAVLWTDLCYVKYSDYNFFGEVDKENNFTMNNRDDNTENAIAFSNAATTLLGNLSLNATAENNMFAVGHTSIPEDINLYGMVQCSRDLSYPNCSLCINRTIEGLPEYANRATGFPIGGRAITGSCMVRYETYNFTYSA